MLRVIKTEAASAEEIMALDTKFLEHLDPKGPPLLHLYRWVGPSLTFGHFIAPDLHLNMGEVARHHLSLARRPTGGGIVFHIWDLAFSFLMPSAHPLFSLNTLDNYRFVNEVVRSVMKKHFALPESVALVQDTKGSNSYDFCMAKPTQYDVVHGGMKIAGAAQRRKKQGYLHQGTLSLALPDERLLRDVLLQAETIVPAMLRHTFAPLGRIDNLQALEEVRAALEKELAQEFMEKL